MKNRVIRPFMSLLICIGLGMGQGCVQKSSEKTSVLEAEIDAYIRPCVDGGGFSGSILIAKGGEVLLNKGYGMASYELEVEITN